MSQFFFVLLIITIASLCSSQYVPDKKDQKCLHKKETRFNQRIPIESPALRVVLKRYEELHKEATTTENIKEVFLSADSPDKVKYKYVYMQQGSSGLGNRLISILSGFLFALLTDRVLLIKSMDYDFNSLLCQPFHNSSWILPEGIEINKISDKIKRGGSAGGGQYGNMKEPDYIRELKNVPLYYMIDSEQYFMPYIFGNLEFKERLEKWFPSKNVGTVLGKYLFHPRDDIWQEVLESFQSKPALGHSLGMQVRTQSNWNQQLSCFGDIPNESYIYIASLGNIKDNLKKINPTWIITQKYSEGSQVNDLNQVKHALYDIFLLSLTDRCAISAHSTFGYLIMALKGSMCIFSKDTGESKDPPCYMPNSHEICHHLGQKSVVNKVFHNNTYTDGCRDWYQNQGLQINFGRHLTTSKNMINKTSTIYQV